MRHTTLLPKMSGRNCTPACCESNHISMFPCELSGTEPMQHSHFIMHM